MMLHITRDKATGAAIFSGVDFADPPPKPEHPEHPVLVPKITQAGDVRFRDWCIAYEYFVDCMMNCLRVKLGNISAISWDWDGVRTDLERYLYQTSANRQRAYILLK